MRHTLVIGLILLASATALGADPPIPQDAAKLEKRRRDRLEWNRRTIQGAYDKVGKKDPRWDEPARKAMDLAARMFSLEVDPVVSFGDIYPPAKAAIDAGCDDPMIVYLYTRTLYGPHYPGAEEMTRHASDAAKTLAASRYPAFRRMVAFKMAGSSVLSIRNPGDEAKKEAERDFDAALALLDESVASDERTEFWEDRWLENLIEMIKGYRALGVDPEAAYKRVDDRLAKCPEMKVVRLLVRGQFWFFYGWEARTNAFAPNVPAGGFETLEKRAMVAQEAFQEAWKLRPDKAKAAEFMLDIDKGIGGDRPTMELWFDRAMKADGDSYGACLSKLDWLDPKWHGTPEEMVAFGRACRDTKNWHAGITLLVADAHRRLTSRMSPEDRVKYLGSPEVWAEIQSVFDEYLKHYPDNDATRSKYASMGYMAGHYPEAHAQFEILGDRLTTWYDLPNFPLVALKMQKDIVAQAIAGKAPENDADGRPIGWSRINGRSPEGAWTVDLPVIPEMRKDAGILGTTDRLAFTCAAKGITYALRVQRVSADARADGAKAVMNAARDAIVKECAGQARDEHAAKIAERPAQEYLIEAPALQPKVIRVRTALIGEWLYEFSVLGSQSDVSGPAANTFLDSLKFQ